MTDTLLVTGASGKLGRGIIRHLLESEGIAPGRIVAVTRDPAKIADLAAKGVEVRAGSFDDEAGLVGAFAGAGRILIVSTDDLSVPGKRLGQHLSAVRAAVKAGAGHVLYTSMPNPEPGSAVVFANDHYGTEQAIRESGLPYTILRVSWYQENLFMNLPQVLAGGHWYTSAGDGRVAHVAHDDVAAAAAGALAGKGGAGSTLTLTGPAALTTAEIAALAAEATGKPIAVVQLSDEALAAGMAAAGVPAPFVPVLVSFDANTRKGGVDIVTDAVERLSGCKPAPLRRFLEANRGTLLGK